MVPARRRLSTWRGLGLAAGSGTSPTFEGAPALKRALPGQVQPVGQAAFVGKALFFPSNVGEIRDLVVDFSPGIHLLWEQFRTGRRLAQNIFGDGVFDHGRTATRA